MLAQAADTDYDAFMRCDARPGWLPDAQRELKEWLHSKFPDWDVDVDAGGSWHAGTAGLGGRNDNRERVELSVYHEQARVGRVLHARLTETEVDGPVWDTELLAVDGQQESWLRLRTANSVGSFVRVPRLAKNLMRVLQFSDGHMQFSPEAQLHRPHDVPDVLELLKDPDRHGLVFVAGTETGLRSVDGFRSRVSRWSREVYGLAQAIVLDPLATLQFNNAVGDAHAAQPWSIRTYRPGVDIGEASDGRRHRYLMPSSLERPSVDKLLGAIARGQASGRVLPRAVETVADHVERAQARRARQEHQTVAADRATDGLPATTELPSASVRKRATAQLQRKSAAARHPYRLDPSRAATSPGVEAVPPIPAHPIPAPPIFAEPEPGTTGVETPALPSAEPVTTSRPTAAPTTDTSAELLDLVRILLDIEEVTEESLIAAVDRIESQATRQIRAARDELDELIAEQNQTLERQAAELREVKAAIEEEQFERADAEEQSVRFEDECHELRATVDDLRRRLYTVGDTEVWTRPLMPQPVRRPASFIDLLERLTDLGGRVVFTGDEDVTIALEANDVGNASRSAWNAILALDGYVRASLSEGFNGDVHEYLTSPPTGFPTVPTTKHARTESESTLNQYAAERCFPVPTDVDPGGRRLMTAHFKLAKIGMISPRMHYLDDVRGTGRVYVGYIGRHLRVASTN